jgi:N-acetylmuramoyl-L-alanine amidase
MAMRAASVAILGLLAVATPAAAEPPSTVPAAESFPVATDTRLGGDEAQTRFVMDLSQKVDLRVFVLADPYRVVVDIPQVTFALPAKTGETGRGLIKAFRYGLVMKGGSRLVFDLARPAKVEKAFVVDAASGSPARLVLELAATDRESFLRKAASGSKAGRSELPPSKSAPSDSDERPLVVLDPGHGGPDTGAKGSNGEMEKDIVLNFALRLKERLEKAGKYRVQLTRSDDTFIPLAERVHIARSAGAALFVSIHADSLPSGEGDARGATVYTLSDTASDSESARLADQENRSDVIAGVDLKTEPDDVAGILIDLAQRETKSLSTQFAHKLVSDLKSATLLHKTPVKSAGFRVLRAPDIPSVLVELGYVSNREDLRSLLSDNWRGRTADSVAHAIDEFFAVHVAGAARAGAHSGSRAGAN